VSSSVADPDPGSGAFFNLWIQDPGWVKSKDPDPGSGIWEEQPGSYFLELRNHIFGVKILEFYDADLGWRNSDPGSGMEKKSDPGSGINIPDPQHW
jgi:hypothetical protein